MVWKEKVCEVYNLKLRWMAGQAQARQAKERHRNFSARDDGRGGETVNQNLCIVQSEALIDESAQLLNQWAWIFICAVWGGVCELSEEVSVVGKIKVLPPPFLFLPYEKNGGN